jgi:hypothetical protein
MTVQFICQLTSHFQATRVDTLAANKFAPLLLVAHSSKVLLTLVKMKVGIVILSVYQTGTGKLDWLKKLRCKRDFSEVDCRKSNYLYTLLYKSVITLNIIFQ